MPGILERVVFHLDQKGLFLRYWKSPWVKKAKHVWIRTLLVSHTEEYWWTRADLLHIWHIISVIHISSSYSRFRKFFFICIRHRHLFIYLFCVRAQCIMCINRQCAVHTNKICSMWSYPTAISYIMSSNSIRANADWYRPYKPSRSDNISNTILALWECSESTRSSTVFAITDFTEQLTNSCTEE